MWEFLLFIIKKYFFKQNFYFFLFIKFYVYTEIHHGSTFFLLRIKIIGQTLWPKTKKKLNLHSIFLQINKNVVKKIINMEDPKIDQSIKDKIEITTNFYKGTHFTCYVFSIVLKKQVHHQYCFIYNDEIAVVCVWIYN